MLDQATLETIRKYGLATVAAVIISFLFYQFNIVPANVEREQLRDEAAEERAMAREERKANAKALVESAKEVSKTNQSLVETNRSLAESYQTLTDSTKASVKILEQIRDDQKKFPAVREANEPRP